MHRLLGPALPLFLGAVFAAVFGGAPPMSGPVDLRVASLEAVGAAAAAPAPQFRTPLSDRGPDERSPDVPGAASARSVEAGALRQARPTRPGRLEPHPATFLRARFTTGPPAHP